MLEKENVTTIKSFDEKFVDLEILLMNIKKSDSFLYAFIFLTFFCTNVGAVVVSPGDSAFMPGTTLTATTELNGTVIYEDSLTYNLYDGPFPLFQGHAVKNKVIRSNLAGSLIFALQLLNSSNTIAGDDVLIDSISLNGYAGWQTDVHYRTDATGDRGPTFVERSADGDDLLLTFGFPLLIGDLAQDQHEDSYPIEIVTNADFYDTSGRATIRGHTAAGNAPLQVSIGGLAVPTAVPLPASFSLFLAGIGLLLGSARNRQKA